MASGKVPDLGLSLQQDSGTAKDGAAGGGWRYQLGIISSGIRFPGTVYRASISGRTERGGLERDSVSLLSLPMTPLVLAGEKSGFRCPGRCLSWVSGKPEVAEFESG